MPLISVSQTILTIRAGHSLESLPGGGPVAWFGVLLSYAFHHSSIFTLYLPILLIVLASSAAIAIGNKRKILWMTAAGSFAILLTVIFACAIIPGRRKVERNLIRIEALVESFETSFAEYQKYSTVTPAPNNAQLKEFIETRLVAPLDEAQEIIRSSATTQGLKSVYALRATKVAIRRAGTDFLVLNIELSDRVQKLDTKLRSHEMSPTDVSNLIAREVIPALEKGSSHMQEMAANEDLTVNGQRKFVAESHKFSTEWGQQLRVEMLGLEELAIHTSLMNDLHQYFGLRGNLVEPPLAPATNYLHKEFAAHVADSEGRWTQMQQYFSEIDPKAVAGLQRQLTNLRSIYELLLSDDNDEQLCGSFATIVEGWQKKRWSNPQTLAFIEKDLRPRLLAADGGAADTRGPASQKTDLQMKIRALHMARGQVIEKLTKEMQVHSSQLNNIFDEWMDITRSSLKHSMSKAVVALDRESLAYQAIHP